MSASANPVAQFQVVEPKDGTKQIYANVSHLIWTGMDVTAQIYQIVQPNRDVPSQADLPNTLVHHADVTFTWTAAKTFHALLSDVLARHEKAYGPIRTDFVNI